MDKRTDYHFGEHVFNYFPWYSYGDVSVMPTLNESIWDEFKGAFYEDFKEMPLVWCDRDNNYKYALINTGLGYGLQAVLEVIDVSVARYKDMEETISDWSDIEKIRLRCLLGTEEKAKKYMSIINFYRDQREIINDAIFSETGSEKEVSIISIQQIMNYDKSVWSTLIDVDDVYKCLENGKCSNYSKYISSIHSYYYNHGHLTEKQIDVTKSILYKEILRNKKPTSFFKVKTDKIPNIKRIRKYFKAMGLRSKLFDNFMLVN